MVTSALLILASLAFAADEARVQAALVNRIDQARRAVGIVAAEVDEHGSRIWAHGRVSKEDPRKPDGDTVFETGSLNQIFTALLLADMAERGELRLGDKAGSVTLLDLATHTATGRYTYSPEGYGLLAQALSARLGVDYGEALRTRVLRPLGMSSTSVAAGRLHSTANDLLKFVAAHAGLHPTPLDPAMRLMRAIRRDAGMERVEIAIGWHILKRFAAELFWHNGQAEGSRAFAGIDPLEKKGAVVLCNTGFDVDDIGRYLLRGAFPLADVAGWQ